MTHGMDFAIIFGFQELLGISDQAWELSAWVPATQGRSLKTSFLCLPNIFIGGWHMSSGGGGWQADIPTWNSNSGVRGAGTDWDGCNWSRLVDLRIAVKGKQDCGAFLEQSYSLIWAFVPVMCMCAQSFQSCLTLCCLMDCGLSGSSVHGIFQARILEWVTMPSSRGSSWPWGQTQVSCTGRRVLYY